MTFDETLMQVIDLLRREGRVSYRALKLRFNLDDEYLAGLKAEIIKAKKLAIDEDGEVLVWTGEGTHRESENRRIGEPGNRGIGEERRRTAIPSDARRQTLDSPRPEAERRQLTVMFCDVVGYTALSAQLDPEELREVMRAYQQVCAEVITRFDGHLAKYLGDGLLVYFGYPAAHEDDAQRAVRAGLEIVGAIRASPLHEVAPLFASLLSLPLPEGRYPPLNLTPQRQKQKTLEALLAWLVAEAERQPLPFIVEDPHWADPSTLEFLSLLIDQGPTARMLTVLAFRPEFAPPWTPRSHLTQITLNRLSHRQVEAMVGKITGDKGLPTAVVQQIVTKTDGVPLFVEELTKAVVESGLSVGATHASPSSLAIPATLQDSLMARLDRLGTAKEVAQMAATLGREFAYELLQAVSPVDEESLRQALAKLVEAEVLYQRGLPPQAHYFFKHALIQDAAYQSLLKSTRQQYHQQIAQVLEAQFPETKETQPELLAYHCTEAGLSAQAIPYRQRAGQSATQRSANVEAISHLTKGLELLQTLPDTPERAQQELTLQIALGVPLQATKGYAAPEVEKAYVRARELCQQLGETPQLLPVLLGLQRFYCFRAKFQTARELGEQCLALAQRAQDPTLFTWVHNALGVTLFHLGEFASARAHLEQGVAFYDPQKHRSLLALQDPGVSCLSYLALVLWYLGYPDQAYKRSLEALTLAQELSHTFNLAFALNYLATLHRFRREGQATQGRVEAALALSTEQGFPQLLTWGTILQGWALAEQGQGEEGIAQMRQGIAARRAMGAELLRPYGLSWLAEAHGKVGQAEEGLTLLSEALATLDKTGEREYRAELYRLKGQLTLQKEAGGWRLETSPLSSQASSLKPQVSRAVEQEAEGYFLKAIEIARQQQTKSWELRAVMSLARLWQQQGRKAEARQLLADIYGWFTEGFDTADLREAKALLEQLSRVTPAFPGDRD